MSTSLRSYSEGSDKERTESLDSDMLLLSEGRSQLGSVDYSEFYEDPAVLYERMSRAEEVRLLLICTSAFRQLKR